ncbi:helix-turn-helix domain-containing protein [Streptomyces vietnamensis]|uniref:helix-turn-helix domain-containing protein n=1 Tax=Streptomyces vietnamensis TaxID=362257 RepID=UPI00379FCD14
MTEVARTRGSSSEIERGEVPEVAALGNVLKELFTRLGISQNQYAYRVHLDKSAVSRYLSGRRVAPQDFIDRLVQEIEDHLGAPLQLEAKEALRGRRLEALRVCSPDEFRLEGLRDELARSRRDTERAHRNIEALNALLDKKEAEARDVADDLTRLRLDWGAERSALARAREDLLRQVARLRQDLQDAEALRAEAERQTRELRDHVLDLEEELSRSAVGDLPLDMLKSRLLAMWEEERFPEAARELTEAAWSRPVGEVIELSDWLEECGAAMTPETFVADAGRLRPLEEALAFAPEAVLNWHPRMRDAWRAAVAARLTDRNAAAIYQRLRDPETRSNPEGDRVLAEALRRVPSDSDAAALVLAALAGTSSPTPLTRVARRLTVERPADPLGLGVLVKLAEAGRSDVVDDLLAHLLQLYPLDDLAKEAQELDHEQIDVLFDLVTGLEDAALLTHFAACLSFTSELIERLLETVHAHGRLGHLDLVGFPEVAACVNGWRRSRFK